MFETDLWKNADTIYKQLFTRMSASSSNRDFESISLAGAFLEA
jgi:hypothetical protein